MKKGAVIAVCISVLVVFAIWASNAKAYPTYSQGKVTNPDGTMESYGYCRTCHGQFRATNEENSTPYLQDQYISLKDRKAWITLYQPLDATEPELFFGLHDIHREVMLEKVSRGRCDTCHMGSTRYPVYLGASASTALPPISCVGCHGRQEDAGHDGISEGLGAGLRQRHTRSGVTECKTCHADANPALYTPVGEKVLPPYYFSPDPEFPNKPTDPCNQHGEEDYAGTRRGLDNDGDGKFDMADQDCR